MCVILVHLVLLKFAIAIKSYITYQCRKPLQLSELLSSFLKQDLKKLDININDNDLIQRNTYEEQNHRCVP